MKKNLLYLSFLGCLSWMIFSAASGGRAAGGQDRTGSPVSSGTCASCHSGGTFGADVTAVLKDNGGNVVTSYIPGQTYTFEVQVTSSSGSPNSYGAQSVALLSGNSQAGTFTAIGPTNQVASLSGREYPEQQGRDADGFFEYSWVAPTSGSGDAVFYSIGLAVNGSGTGGDQASSSKSMTITEAAPPPTCNAPTNLTVTNIGSTTADFGFTTGGASLWEVEVVLNGTGTNGVGNISSSNPVELTGLMPNTSYDAYVRDVCSSPLTITGVIDADLTGGVPKAMEFYVSDTIAHLSDFGLAKVSNGAGTAGAPNYNFLDSAYSAGDFIYITTDSTAFRDYMGFNADFIWGGLSINGDDAVELYQGTTVIDVFGDVANDGTGESWEYEDSWAYRNDNTIGSSTFTDTDWTYGGVSAIDGCTDNGTCASQWPVGTFTTTPLTSTWEGPFTFTTTCGSIVLDSTVTNISCNGLTDGAISLNPSGASSYSYLWSHGVTTPSTTGLGAATYTVTVTYSGSCITTESFSITEPSALSLTVSGNDLTCNQSGDGDAMAAVSGGNSNYTYLWSDGATNASITGLDAIAYDVTVMDGACTITDGVTLTEPSAITISNTTNTSVTCNGGNDGALIVVGTGGASPISYLWSTTETTASISGLSEGSYTVTVTSGNCDEVMSYTISEPNAFNLSVTTIDATTNGGTDGTATAVVDVASDYTYVWSNAQTNQTATGLGVGGYTVTVTNTASGCMQTANGVVADPAACNLTVTASQTDVNCFNGADGTATVSVSGGPSIFYTYLWSDSQTTETATGLMMGEYTVTVSSGSCMDSISVTLTEPSLITGTDSVSICSGDSILLGGVYVTTAGFYNDTVTAANMCDSVVTVEVTTLQGVYAGEGDTLDVCASDFTADLFEGVNNLSDSSGSWSTFLGNSTIFPITTGVDTMEYTYTIDDGNGTTCSIDSTIVTVIIHAAPNAGGNPTTSACASAGTINLMAELNTPDTPGIWDDVDATGALTDSLFDVTTAGIGTYLVQYSVAGNEGCVGDTANITIDVLTNPNAGTGGTLDACDTDLTLDPADGLSDNPDAGGTWNDLDNSGAFFFGTFSPTAAGEGQYDFSYVVDAQGCASDSTVVTIVVNASPNAGNDASDSACVTETVVDLEAMLGGTQDAGGTWTDVDGSGALTGATFNPSVAGEGIFNFSYTVTGTAPCADATATVTITVASCINSLDENTAAIAVSLFPNPNNGSFILDAGNETVNFELLDITGKVVSNGSFTGKQEMNLVLESGVYFMSSTVTGETQIIKIIVE